MQIFFKDLVLQILKSCIDEVYPTTSAMDFSHGLCELLHHIQKARGNVHRFHFQKSSMRQLNGHTDLQ